VAIRTSFLAILSLLGLLGCGGQSVKYFADGIRTDAIYTPAVNTKDTNPPAVIVIHSAGGSDDGTTKALAAALNKQGIATLEPSYWKRGGGFSPEVLIPTIFGAIEYLAEVKGVDPQRVGIAGYSFGANMSLLGASQHYTNLYGKGYKFAAIAPIYPPCWLNEQVMLGKRDRIKGMPRKIYLDEETFEEFVGSPISIYAAGKDDYDSRDPDACQKMINVLPNKARKDISLKVYEGATHGWNQIYAKKKPLKFWVPYACKGEGCEVTLEWNEKVTKQNVSDVTKFFVDQFLEK
jgi:uncharacterized protein